MTYEIDFQERRSKLFERQLLWDKCAAVQTSWLQQQISQQQLGPAKVSHQQLMILKIFPTVVETGTFVFLDLPR
jgi:hypothetical protein